MRTIGLSLLLVLLMFVIEGQTLRCIVCSTNEFYACRYSTDQFLTTQCAEGEVCKKVYAQLFNGATAVIRSCARVCKEEVIEEAVGEYYSTCCDDADGCNGGIRSTSHSLVLLTMSLFGVASYWFIIHG